MEDFPVDPTNPQHVLVDGKKKYTLLPRTADDTDINRLGRVGRNDGTFPYLNARRMDKKFSPFRRPGHRACDSCRRRKTKCDGAKPSCGRCLRDKFNCTYCSGRARGRPATNKVDNQNEKTKTGAKKPRNLIIKEIPIQKSRTLSGSIPNESHIVSSEVAESIDPQFFSSEFYGFDFPDNPKSAKEFGNSKHRGFDFGSENGYSESSSFSAKKQRAFRANRIDKLLSQNQPGSSESVGSYIYKYPVLSNFFKANEIYVNNNKLHLQQSNIPRTHSHHCLTDKERYKSISKMPGNLLLENEAKNVMLERAESTNGGLQMFPNILVSQHTPGPHVDSAESYINDNGVPGDISPYDLASAINDTIFSSPSLHSAAIGEMVDPRLGHNIQASNDPTAFVDNRGWNKGEGFRHKQVRSGIPAINAHEDVFSQISKGYSEQTKADFSILSQNLMALNKETKALSSINSPGYNTDLFCSGINSPLSVDILPQVSSISPKLMEGSLGNSSSIFNHSLGKSLVTQSSLISDIGNLDFNTIDSSKLYEPHTQGLHVQNNSELLSPSLNGNDLSIRDIGNKDYNNMIISPGGENMNNIGQIDYKSLNIFEHMGGVSSTHGSGVKEPSGDSMTFNHIENLHQKFFSDIDMFLETQNNISAIDEQIKYLDLILPYTGDSELKKPRLSISKSLNKSMSSFE